MIVPAEMGTRGEMNQADLLSLTGANPSSDRFIRYWSGRSGRSHQEEPLGEWDGFPVEALGHFHVRTSSLKRIEALVFGRGRPLLLIGGLGVTAPIWLNQLEGLAADHRVLIIHKPGHGLSETVDDLSFDGVARTILDVATCLGFAEPLHVVGACIGANVALALAAMEPTRVATLTLVNVVGSESLEELGTESKDRHGVKALMESLRELDRTLCADLYRDIRDVPRDGGLDGKRAVEIYENSKSIDPLAYVQYVVANAGVRSSLPATDEVRARCLLLVGEKDSAVDAESTWKLRSRIPNSICAGIPNAGHYPYLTRAREFNKILRDFVDGA